MGSNQEITYDCAFHVLVALLPRAFQRLTFAISSLKRLSSTSVVDFDGEIREMPAKRLELTYALWD